MRHSQIAVTASKQPFTFYLVAACIYLCLTIVAMSSLALLEKRAARGFRRSYA
ncbi:Octopine transport system permease protein OccQ [compost metagenome]